MRPLPFALVFASLFTAAAAQQTKEPHPAATLGLLDLIPWSRDGAEYYDHAAGTKATEDRTALIDAACARAKKENKLVLWYVHRIEENKLHGRQMYRAPVLDVYMQQVVFADRDVAAMVTECFVPVRCALDEKLSARFGLRPLAFIEPAVVFLDGDGKVVHFVERIRTFHAQWFADLLARLLEQQQIPRRGDDPAALRKLGLWHPALAMLASKGDKTPADWLLMAELQRLARQPDRARESLDRATAMAGGDAKPADDDAPRPAQPDRKTRRLLGDVQTERGLLLTMQGRLLDAQPVLEAAWRGTGDRADEAGYWYALNALHLGDETGAMRRFALVAERFPATPFGKRARANTALGPDDRPVGAAFTGFENVRYLPETAYQGMPNDTAWNGPALQPKDLARQALEFLLEQQRDDGGFTDARYAYWPNSQITPNVWVAITAIALTALYEYEGTFADLRPRIERALQRGEAFAFDPKRLNRGANEDCYADAYRLLYLSRRAADADPAARAQWIARMNEIVQQAATRQKASGFWAHEYENAFATGAVLQELIAARASGATVPAEVTDKGATALISARFKNGTFVYGGSANQDGRPTGLKDACGRMPVCEASLLVLGRSDLDKLRFALNNFWDSMQNLEGVRRNDFHSDGELGGFFFFHAVFHASEAVKFLPEDERAPHWQKFVALLQKIPEMDGSFVDSHEFGRSYGTGMALLILHSAARFE
jgi:hypothetical protein